MAMTSSRRSVREVLSPDDADARLVEINKGQQFAGHFPSAAALARARRVLVGETTPDEARAEILGRSPGTWALRPHTMLLAALVAEN